MTLVAIIKGANQYFIMGDILLSGDSEMKIPYTAFHDIKSIKYKNPKLKASKFAQKISIIGKNLVIGWCGNQFSARQIIKKIEAISPDSVIDLFEFFNNNDVLENIKNSNDVNDHVSFLGLFYQEETEIPFRWDSIKEQKFQSNLPWTEFIIGSGAEHFKSLFNSSDYGGKIIEGATDEIIVPFYVLNRVLTDNFISNKNISNHYGGDFEIAYLDSKDFKYKKFYDYNFVCFEVFEILNDGIRLSNPLMIMKKFYHDETLGVYRQIYKYEKNKPEASTETQIWLVEKITEDAVKKSDIKLPENFDLNSPYQITFFYLNPKKTKADNCYSMIFYPPIFSWFTQENGQGGIGVTEDNMPRFQNAVKEMMRDLQKQGLINKNLPI